MPTKATTKRVPVALEEPLYDALSEAADRDRVSLSTKARDLIRRAMEIEEDEALVALVEDRMQRPGRLIPHEEFWREARLRRKARGR
jgi:hypothetical protein